MECLVKYVPSMNLHLHEDTYVATPCCDLGRES